MRRLLADVHHPSDVLEDPGCPEVASGPSTLRINEYEVIVEEVGGELEVYVVWDYMTSAPCRSVLIPREYWPIVTTADSSGSFMTSAGVHPDYPYGGLRRAFFGVYVHVPLGHREQIVFPAIYVEAEGETVTIPEGTVVYRPRR
ncbi:MAG: hypothetical protein ACE367_25225 [Acidimicrobiales bacterium]